MHRGQLRPLDQKVVSKADHDLSAQRESLDSGDGLDVNDRHMLDAEQAQSVGADADRYACTWPVGEEEGRTAAQHEEHGMHHRV